MSTETLQIASSSRVFRCALIPTNYRITETRILHLLLSDAQMFRCANAHEVSLSCVAQRRARAPPGLKVPLFHSPVLVVYCKLPRFLKGARGLFLAAAAVPGGRLVDMVPGRAAQLASEGVEG